MMKYGKKNRGTPFITLWFEEEMSVVMIMNRNTEQNIGLRPHFLLGGEVRLMNWNGVRRTVLFGESNCEASNDAEWRMAA